VIDVTHFTDPGCPWAYSAWPAHTTLRWRYGEQLRWTLVMIGLTEDAGQYAARGYTPTRSAVGYGRFRRFGMPFQITPKARLSATSPACRAIVATRLVAPPLEDAALRALQFAQFTTTGMLDDPDTLRSALAGVEGLDADAVVGRIDDPEVVAAYQGRASPATALHGQRLILAVAECRERRGGSVVGSLLPQTDGCEGFLHCLEHRQPHDLAFAEGPNVSGVGHRFDAALSTDPNQTNGSDDLVSRVDEVLGLHPPGRPLLPNEPHELPDSAMPTKDKRVKGPPRQVINDFRVEETVIHLATTVEVLVATPHHLHVLLRNTRSPRRLRHGFQRNAVPQAFELAHESLRDALAVFAS
jgi:2-hydroxychromene-2-carboxylate isomerase